MDLFYDPADEERLCQVLRALVEEWRPAAIIVSFPKSWQRFGYGPRGRIRFEFSMDRSISIRVEYGTIQFRFDMALRRV